MFTNSYCICKLNHQALIIKFLTENSGLGSHYKRGLCTKQGLKAVYETSHVKVVIYKNKLAGLLLLPLKSALSDEGPDSS